MTNFDSLYWKRKGSGLSLGIDFKSIEREGRTVIGFASLDNIDFADDIVPIEASIKAFENFRGNIRMQHDKTKPVGTLKGFEVEDYFDSKTGQTHKGIKVAVYISEGAEDVWKMVQDGTLSAFSIGAAVKAASKVYNEELRKNIQVIDEYQLMELSLVDSPMNELCNVVSVHKSFDSIAGDVEKDFVSSSLLWCGFDRLSKKGKLHDVCPKCGDEMAVLGHYNEDVDIATQLNKVFEISEKGGHPQVADTVEKDNGEEVVSEVEEVTAVEETEVAPVETEEETEVEAETEVEVEAEADSEEEITAEEANEEAVAEVDNNEDTSNAEAATPGFDESKFQEFLDQLRDAFVTHMEDSKKSADAQLEVLVKSVETLAEVVKGLKDSQDASSAKVEAVENKMNETKERLDVVAGEVKEHLTEPAVKKSLDSVHERETTTKSREADLFDGFFTAGIPGWDK